MSPGNRAVDTIFEYLDEQARREFENRNGALFRRAGISFDQLLAALPKRLARKLRRDMPDDLGSYDAQVFSTLARLSPLDYSDEERRILQDRTMSTIDASTLIRDIRDDQCRRGHHRWFHSHEPDGYPAITWGYQACRHCGIVQHRPDPNGPWEVIHGAHLPPERPPLPVATTYRTISTPPEAIEASAPRRPWWRRLLGLA